MKYGFQIFLSLTLFLGVVLIVLEATLDLPGPYALFTLVDTRHNYPVPWKNRYSKGCLEDRGKYEGMCKPGCLGFFFIKKTPPKSPNHFLFFLSERMSVDIRGGFLTWL